MAIRYKGHRSQSTDQEASSAPFERSAEIAGGGYASARSDTTRPARTLSFVGLAVAAVATAGIALSIALLYQGMAWIMENEGGFVASGGPYVIAHPAPDWVAVMPLAVVVLLMFGVLNVFASRRGWGANASVLGWSALFVSLGWNFLRYGLNPPEGMQDAWAWVMCGVVFWIMGLAPLLLLVPWFRSAYVSLVARQNSDAQKVWSLPSRAQTGTAYIVSQAVGVVVGIWCGIAVFASVSA